MTDSANLFLGVIAVATLLIAIVQIGVLVAAGVLARRIARVTSDVEQEIKPIFAHLDAIGRDAARGASIASTQVDGPIVCLRTWPVGWSTDSNQCSTLSTGRFARAPPS